jgi:predicted ATPase
MYVRSLHIQNLRCFREAELTLQYPGREQESPPTLPNVNLLLGDNGSGKTTVLKGIALAVLARVLEGSGYVPYQLTRHEAGGLPSGSAQAEVDLVLDVQDFTVDIFRYPEPLLISAKSGIRVKKIGDLEQLELLEKDSELEYWKKVYEEESAAFLLVGYGSTRWSQGDDETFHSPRKRRILRFRRVAGLFDEQILLTPLASWLPDLQRQKPGRFLEIRGLINDLLPEGTSFLEEIGKDEYLFEHCGIAVPFGALSDGYRAYLDWVTDLLYHMNLGCPRDKKLQDLQGVVLVDEIDLHLHPAWQRQVVPTLSKALPNLQFVLSTHSPIVAGTLSAKNIFVLEMDDSGASTVRQLEESIHGLNADQVLVSPYFNLMTSRAPDAVDGLRRLTKKAMEGDRDAALSFLEQLVGGSEVKPGR